MDQPIDFATMLSEADSQDRRLGLFAVLTLGVVEMLSSGALSSQDAVKLYFHAANCSYVCKHLKNKSADNVFSHGVQLPDLLDTLPQSEAPQEFQRELGAIRALCVKLMKQHQLVA